ncbi:glycoprotein hormones alpha chain [Syngnathus acus]|uniref:glycoprotein hormones alpha chain n=1 Tax=Syngnathus acus TaxID=161584 RepID=UPI001885D868|nr:glycoprotein hormones alpha chain [Syngnathus acus]
MENRHTGIKLLSRDGSLSESRPEQRHFTGKTSTTRKETTATIMGSVKSVGPLIFLLATLLYITNSYPDLDFSHIGCEECTLKKSKVFSRDQPIFQCQGCCFSRAYPTPLRVKKFMMNPKNITSEAACCTASSSHEVKVRNFVVRNHTGCYCGTCIYHKI